MSNTVWFRSSGSVDEAGISEQPVTSESVQPLASDQSLELSLADLPDREMSLTQPPSPQSRWREPSQVDLLQQPPSQRRRLNTPPNFGQRGRGPLSPHPPLFPPLPTRVADRPEPSAATRNEVLYVGNLLPGQARVLGQFLWVGRTELDGPIRYFEATYEGPNDDQYWGAFEPPIPPQEGARHWGHHRWLLGHPRELSEADLAAQVGDMTHRTLRFLHLP
jgi:hypothetical protein